MKSLALRINIFSLSDSIGIQKVKTESNYINLVDSLNNFSKKMIIVVVPHGTGTSA